VQVQAARLEQHGQELQIREIELAAPGDGEVLVDIAFAGVNPVDMYAAQGRVAPDGPLPRTMGTEGAGTVDGRPVLVRGHGIGTARDGLWAAAAVVPRVALIDIPAGVGLAEAAAMGVAGVTAWRTVTELGKVSGSDTVLVLGASGGVGSVIVTAALALGARVVAQTGQAVKRDWIAGCGADEVIVADENSLAEALRKVRPTVVFDPLGGPYTGIATEALRPRGRLVLFGTSAGPEGALPLQLLYRKSLSLLGYAGLIESDETMTAAISAALKAHAAGQLSVSIDSVLPLRAVNDAFFRLRHRDVCGKLVLDTSGAAGKPASNLGR
jgi:NADPH2:quinone reductase